MKISRKIYAVVIGLVVSTAVFAASQDETDKPQDMPMMNQGGSMMMSPEMMKQMMASGQYQNMPMMDHNAMQQMMNQMPYMGHGMPMMGGGMGNMMMNPQMMHQKPYMGHGMPMMSGGMGNMMMNPQMMQMRMQHMMKMEQHLAKIESLLAQILEAQKSK